MTLGLTLAISLLWYEYISVSFANFLGLFYVCYFFKNFNFDEFLNVQEITAYGGLDYKSELNEHILIEDFFGD